MYDLLNQSFSMQPDRLKTIEITLRKEDFMNYSDYIKAYEDLSRQVGEMVLANEIAKRLLEPVGGSWDEEIYQFYIVSDPSFLLEHTDELVFYYSELDRVGDNTLRHRMVRRGSSRVQLNNYVFNQLSKKSNRRLPRWEPPIFYPSSWLSTCLARLASSQVS